MSLTGKIVYHSIYKPFAWLKTVIRYGGIINIIRIELCRRAMYRSSKRIVYPITDKNAITVYYLTGKKYWALTAFCFYSLIKVSSRNFKPVFIDDGTFDEKLTKTVLRQFPGCLIRSCDEIDEILKKKLPPSKFPLLNKKRKGYPHIRKLTDIHIGSVGWKLVLDSDMLFFSNPKDIIAWIDKPSRPFFLQDSVSSYHYDIKLMEKLSGHTIFPKINVGVVGLKSEDIDWEKIEMWISILEQKGGTNYLLEQALSAMLSGDDPVIADTCKYIVMPRENEVKEPNAVLHHYVAQSKEWYFKYGWLKIKI